MLPCFVEEAILCSGFVTILAIHDNGKPQSHPTKDSSRTKAEGLEFLPCPFSGGAVVLFPPSFRWPLDPSCGYRAVRRVGNR